MKESITIVESITHIVECFSAEEREWYPIALASSKAAAEQILAECQRDYSEGSIFAIVEAI